MAIDDKYIKDIEHLLFIEDTRDMLRQLADKLTSKTRIYVVPTDHYAFVATEKTTGPYPELKITSFELGWFFDMMLGYDSIVDTLVYWDGADPDKRLFKSEDLVSEATKEILRILADHFTRNTKLLEVPVGSSDWSYEEFEDLSMTQLVKMAEEKEEMNQLIKHKTVWVPIYKFFGMNVGYSIEQDILVYWRK